MRVSIDLDSHNRLKLQWALLKGRMLCKKPADRIYKTKHGFHIIWESINIPEETMFRYRKIIGDDSNRIKLDMHGHRLKQVLFSEKHYRLYECHEDGERKLIKEESSRRERIK
jgi:hypothetical protein